MLDEVEPRPGPDSAYSTAFQSSPFNATLDLSAPVSTPASSSASLIPTASEFASILTKGRGGTESRTRQSYLYKLAGERLTGEVMESFTSPHMERGKLMEEEARTAYSFVTGLDCETIGFLRHGRAGAAPDALIGKDGLLEIKTKLPHLLIEALFKGEFPPEHKAQCQGQLWIAERDWIDLAIYWPGLPIVIPGPVATKRTSLSSAQPSHSSTRSSIGSSRRSPPTVGCVRALHTDALRSDRRRSLTCSTKAAAARASSGSLVGELMRRRTRTDDLEGKEDIAIVSFFKETTRTSEHSQQRATSPDQLADLYLA